MRQPYTIGPVLGYHGCDREIVGNVFEKEMDLAPSENTYDWLGTGIYFWVDSPIRALDWAVEQQSRGKVKKPYALGAYVHLGNCLNLMDIDALAEVSEAYDVLKRMSTVSGESMPENRKAKPNDTHIFRDLDCAVIEMVHQLREDKNYPPYDTVLGAFEEGGPLYPGAAIQRKTHMQVVVRRQESIVHYFPIRGIEQHCS